MKTLAAFSALALVCLSAKQAPAAAAARAAPPVGYLRDFQITAVVTDDGMSPVLCTQNPDPQNPRNVGGYSRYRDPKKVLSVTLEVVPQGTFVPPDPDAGLDAGAADGGVSPNAGKPFSIGSLEVILKGPNGAVLESQKVEYGATFNQLGTEVCIKGLRDELAPGAPPPQGAATIEFCKPVTVTDLSVTPAEKAMHEASVKQACASIEASNAAIAAAAKGDAGADGGADAGASSGGSASGSGGSASGSGCNVGGTGNGGALLGVFAALGLTLARRNKRAS
jgi:hypothetical protein